MVRFGGIQAGNSVVSLYDLTNIMFLDCTLGDADNQVSSLFVRPRTATYMCTCDLVVAAASYAQSGTGFGVPQQSSDMS